MNLSILLQLRQLLRHRLQVGYECMWICWKVSLSWSEPEHSSALSNQFTDTDGHVLEESTCAAANMSTEAVDVVRTDS
ncbi:hypothetical protein V6N13_138464 [Hibiscus sabdariffa]